MTRVPQTASEAYNPDFELAMKRLRGEIRTAIGALADGGEIVDRVMRTVRPGYFGLWSSCEHHTDVSVGWRTEAERLADEAGQFRIALAEALKLPLATSDEVLVAEVSARFKGVVRAVVGHGYRNGEDLCECGLPVNRADWFDHVETLRAQGVPTATIAVHGADGAR